MTIRDENGELQITQGEWKKNKRASAHVTSPSNAVADCAGWHDMRREQESIDIEQEANATLIAEVGTVTNETGLTPRELKEQRDRLKADLSIAQEKATQYDEEREKRWAVQQQRDELLGALKCVRDKIQSVDNMVHLTELETSARDVIDKTLAKIRGENQ